jgi:hypothetical protein
MKETAYGLADQYLDAESVANIVDAQIENAKTAPFTNDNEKLDMASLLHEMKLDTENGISIDLDILLNRIASIFPFNEKVKEQEILQAALMANAATSQPRRARTAFCDRDSATGLSGKSHNSNISMGIGKRRNSRCKRRIHSDICPTISRKLSRLSTSSSQTWVCSSNT